MKKYPNILVIMSDQLRPFELGCYGNYVVKTPNIDKLASKGVRFENAFTPNPLCSPARSCMISGQYSRTCAGQLNNVREPVEVRDKFPNPTIAELLKETGYNTKLVGKWHIGPKPQLLGFDEVNYPKVNHLNTDQDYYDTNGNHYIVKGYVPEYELKVTTDFLKQEHKKPFFLFHNISLPHMPFFDVPERYKGLYSPDKVIMRPNTIKNNEFAYNEERFKIYMYDYLYYKEKLPGMDKLPENFDLKDLTAYYCGMVTAVDEQVGRIMDCLEETGLYDDTIVVFTSDHGDNLGSHNLFNKQSVNEEAVRIPMIISWPDRFKPGISDTQLVSLIDIAPTIISLVQGNVPDFFQGKDLSTLLSDETKGFSDNAVFIENSKGEIAIRTGDYLYAVMTDNKKEGYGRKVREKGLFFFDLNNDPNEMNNLIETGYQNRAAKLLHERLVEWNRETPWMQSL